MTLNLSQTAHKLRMTTKLVRWLTQHDTCGTNRLTSLGAPPTFVESHVDAFELALSGAWPDRSVPAEITRELEREARGLCGLCGDACDRLEEGHIRRKGKELKFYCQHPNNLILLCPTCHSRYDAGLISHATVEHAKELQQARLLEKIDRDVLTERVIREEMRAAIAQGLDFTAGTSRIVLAATGRTIDPESRLEAVSELMATARAIGTEQPLAGGLVLGVAIEGQLDVDVDSFRYIDSLAQPLPSRSDFDAEFDGYKIMDGHDPSPTLVAWAAHAGAAYECSICSTICIDADVLADALAEHWKELAEEENVGEGEDGDEEENEGENEDDFDETAARNDAFDDIINSGVECGDLWGVSGCCSYHAYVMSKDD